MNTKVRKGFLSVLCMALLSGTMAAHCAVEVSAEEADCVSLHRMYNPNSGEHFYTSSDKERINLLSAGWRYEGSGWVAPLTGDPVYRLYNPNAGDHHYTMDMGLKRMHW